MASALLSMPATACRLADADISSGPLLYESETCICAQVVVGAVQCVISPIYAVAVQLRHTGGTAVCCQVTGNLQDHVP